MQIPEYPVFPTEFLITTMVHDIFDGALDGLTRQEQIEIIRHVTKHDNTQNSTVQQLLQSLGSPDA